DVEQHQIDAALAQPVERLMPIGCELYAPVPLGCEQLQEQVAAERVVLDHQDSFGCAGTLACHLATVQCHRPIAARRRCSSTAARAPRSKTPACASAAGDTKGSLRLTRFPRAAPPGALASSSTRPAAPPPASAWQ